MIHDPFSALRDFRLAPGKPSRFYSPAALEAAGLGKVSCLPVSIRSVLASLLACRVASADFIGYAARHGGILPDVLRGLPEQTRMQRACSISCHGRSTMKLKRLLFAAVLAAAAAPLLAADVGVSVSIGQPGFYGRIDIGDYPPPVVVYRRPMVIEQVEIDRPPIYLHVPPGHAKNWRKHCHKYGACGERVYFVQDRWYNREYVPRYAESHRDRREDRHDEHHDDHRGDHRHDRHGDDHDRGRDH